MNIEGSVAPGYESIKALYAERMQHLAERNTQLCIYVGSERVVDLWASAIDDDNWHADSLTNVFSSGKSIESILLGMLVDRGLLDFNERISSYWPEFAQHGKAELSVADLMRHEAGLAAFDTSLDPEDFTTDSIKQNRMGEVIARQTPRYREGAENRRSYHSLTRGWIANELFRRVEPQGRTMGEFLHAEVSVPFGVDVRIGLSQDDFMRVSRVVPLGGFYQLWQSLLPRRFRRTDYSLIDLIVRLARVIPYFAKSETRGSPPPLVNAPGLEIFNNPRHAACEMPSANTKASARGLAQLAAVMANGGSLEGQTLLGSEAWAAVHEAPIWRTMLAARIAFTQGGLAEFNSHSEYQQAMDQEVNRGREGYYGWMGFGGSIFQWHPERKIGFAYVPTSLNMLDLCNERGKAYQTEVLRCVERLAGGTSPPA